jgi:riboflavin biosynthesis pyrimidine reductase
VRSLLIEGGPTLHRAAWAARVVDQVRVYVTPHRLGPGGLPWGMPATFSLSGPGVRVTPLGPDVLLERDVYWTG